jgi:hypothetical protein
MRVTVTRGARAVAALSIGFVMASQAAAQNASQNTPQCDPTANTKGDIARAQFSMTRAISAIDKGNPIRDLQDVLRLVDNGTDNPTARAYLRGEAYIVYLMQPNTPAVVQRSALGLTSNPTGTIDLYAAADSSFTVVENAAPECATVVAQWRQQKPWLNTLNAAISALNANQLDSAEALAKRSLLLDRKAPYAYSVLGSVAKSRKNWAAANDYWQQALKAAGTDTTYADVRTKTMYEIAAAASDRADEATGAAKRTAAREAIKAWQDYIVAALQCVPHQPVQVRRVVAGTRGRYRHAQQSSKGRREVVRGGIGPESIFARRNQQSRCDLYPEQRVHQGISAYRQAGSDGSEQP